MVAVLLMVGTPVGKAVAMSSTIRFLRPGIVRSRAVRDRPRGVRLEMYERVVRWTDSPARRILYVRMVNWIERQLERLRSVDPVVIDRLVALVFTVLGIVSVFG